MLKLKKAFSLAEVLVAIAIISVILTMCFSITNHTLDKAYSRYIFTGYEGLSDAIKELNIYNINVDKVSQSNYMQSICDMFKGTIDSSNNLLCRTPNGIEYLMAANLYTDTSGSLSSPDIAIFAMSVPSRKKSATHTKDSTLLAYYIQGEPNVLVPLPIINNISNITPTLNLQERADLLPFYIDDGRVGRTINNVYIKKSYLSPRDALCEVYGSKFIRENNTQILNCANSPATIGIVKFENPQKAW